MDVVSVSVVSSMPGTKVCLVKQKMDVIVSLGSYTYDSLEMA